MKQQLIRSTRMTFIRHLLKNIMGSEKGPT